MSYIKPDMSKGKRRMMLAAAAPRMEMVNMPALLDRVGNDHEFLVELFEILEVEFPRLLVVLHQAIMANDLPQAAANAHRLRGMLINLAIEKGAAAAGVLEARAAAGDQPGTESAVAAFNTEVTGLLPELEACIVNANRKGRA